MSEEEPVAAPPDGIEHSLEVGRQLAVGGLYQQVASALVVRDEPQGVIGCIEGPGQVDLTGGDQREGDTLLIQQASERGRALRELLGDHAGVVVAEVRRRRERHHAVGHRPARELEAPVGRRGTIVYARKHVGVEIDHLRIVVPGGYHFCRWGPAQSASSTRPPC